MPSVLAQILWLLKKVGKHAKDHKFYSFPNYGEKLEELWEWIKENKLMAFLIAGVGTVVVVPIASAIAASISVVGAVVALPALAVGGVLAAIEGTRIVRGTMEYLASQQWMFAIDFVMRKQLDDTKRVLTANLKDAASEVAEAQAWLNSALQIGSSATAEDIYQLKCDLRDACERLLLQELEWDEFDNTAQPQGQSPSTQSYKAGDASFTKAACARVQCLQKKLDLALDSNSTASGDEIRRLTADRKSAEAIFALLKLLDYQAVGTRSAAGAATPNSVPPPAAQVPLRGHPQSIASMADTGQAGDATIAGTTPSAPSLSLEAIVMHLAQEISALKRAQAGNSLPPTYN